MISTAGIPSVLIDKLSALRDSATSLGMTSDEEKKAQRIEDIRELLS